MYKYQFFSDLENRIEFMQKYEDKLLQQKALDSMPLTLLEEKAQKRFRELQSQIKKGSLEDVNISIQEMLLLELLAWFKSSFEWVNSPDCDKCGESTQFSHMSLDPQMLAVANRVEMHQCETCHHLTPFYRHTNPETLLITREGRCGEWASCFTLYCRSLGWETRFVLDKTDHVWTEVYSIAQNRWLHCDPCENICDQPLIYENGWGKKLNYIIAFSYDDIQDVTWRYSSDHKKLMENRNVCSEKELVHVILNIRNRVQRNLSDARKKYLAKRCLMELVELMCEKKPTDTDNQGRVSGALAWRLDRGEVGNSEVHNFVFKPSEQELNAGKLVVRYSPTLDRYERVVLENVVDKIEGWQNGAFLTKNIFRKEERDWKMVYICRTERSEEGEIQWKFETENDTVIDKISLKFDQQTFENGQINLILCDKDNCIRIPTSNSSNFSSQDLAGSKSVILKALLTGGRGDCAWQHAQLFRQSTQNKMDYPFQIQITFKKL